ncbi:MAG: three-Cys-motif partner protein TcmP [Vulcanimicrobiota bacterium]
MRKHAEISIATTELGSEITMPKMKPENITWELKEHTRAKHLVLERYLKAWAPILGTWNERILYVDGFAGPGEYKCKTDGSPLIVLKLITGHSRPPKKMTFLFVEAQKDRCEYLKGKLHNSFPDLATTHPNYKVYCIKDDFEEQANGLLDKVKSIIPSFWFIDPFGYSDVSMQLLNRISQNDKAEMLFHFMSSHVKRFVEEKDRDEARTKLYGDNSWSDLKKNDEPRKFVDLFLQKLIQYTKFKYLLDFQLVTKEGHRYHLVFATKSSKGYAEMKGAMWKADPVGHFTFNAKHPKTNEDFLLDVTEIPNLQQILLQEFSGQTKKMEEVHDFVLFQTIFVPSSHLKQKTLTPLLKSKKIEVIGGSSKGFADDCQIRFL